MGTITADKLGLHHWSWRAAQTARAVLRACSVKRSCFQIDFFNLWECSAWAAIRLAIQVSRVRHKHLSPPIIIDLRMEGNQKNIPPLSNQDGTIIVPSGPSVVHIDSQAEHNEGVWCSASNSMLEPPAPRVKVDGKLYDQQSALFRVGATTTFPQSEERGAADSMAASSHAPAAVSISTAPSSSSSNNSAPLTLMSCTLSSLLSIEPNQASPVLSVNASHEHGTDQEWPTVSRDHYDSLYPHWFEYTSGEGGCQS